MSEEPLLRITRPHTFSCMSSSFLASRSSLGTPWGLACALKSSFQSSLQNGAVSFSRNPVSCIWSDLISGSNKLA